MHKTLKFNKYWQLCLLLFPLAHSYAGINELSQEFLQTNFKVARTTWQSQTSHLQNDALWAQKSWFVRAVGGYDKNQLAGQAFTESVTTEKTALILGKNFGWGGEFSFENNLLYVDQRRNRTVAEISGIQDRYYEFQHVFNYKQDLGRNFFGREFRAELEMAQINEEMQDLVAQNVNQNLLLEFYNHYIRARLNKTQVQLQKEALERAQTRKNLIAKRVREGLRERADLYRADLQVHAQEEALNQAKQDYVNSLNELSTRLHRAVKDSEIPLYTFEKRTTQVPLVPTQLEQNKERLALEKNLAYIRENLRKINMGFIPDIQLQGTYKTNATDPEWRDAVNEGKLGSDHREVVAGVAITLPLGFEATKVQRAKERIELMTKEMELKKHLDNLPIMENHLKERVSLLRSNVRSSIDRRELSKKLVGETNRLYNLGRTNLDSVIIAEEELIRTEVTFANYMASLEGVAGLHAMLNGALMDYLTETPL